MLVIMGSSRFIVPARRKVPLGHRLKYAVIALIAAIAMLPSARELGKAASQGTVDLWMPKDVLHAAAADGSQTFVTYVIVHLAVVVVAAMISLSSFREVSRSEMDR